MSADASRLVAIVTGGASGIGAAVVRRLAADGAQVVVVVDVDGPGAKGLASELGSGVVAAARRLQLGRRLLELTRPAVLARSLCEDGLRERYQGTANGGDRRVSAQHR